MSNKNVIRVLEKARAKIEQGWCKEFVARDEHGAVVAPRSPRACSWCAEGAILASTRRLHWPAYDYLADALGDRHGIDVPEWNDAPRRTQKQVLKAFDKAIELAKAE